MPRSIAAVALATAILAGGSAAAGPNPDPPPGVAGGAVDGLTVTAKPRSREQIVRDFVQTYSAPSQFTGRIARIGADFCPQTYGLGTDLNVFITRQVRQRGLEVGAPGKGSGVCNANVRIIFTEDPQWLVEQMASANDSFLGYHHRVGKKEALQVRQPVQGWYVNETMDIDGQVVPDAPGAETDGDAAWLRVLGRTKGLVTRTRSVLIVVDLRATPGVELTALADHIAMLALAQTTVQAACKPMPSITNLFDKSCPAELRAEALTDNDLAYLKALYTTEPTLPPAALQGSIAKKMASILRKAR